MISTLNSSLQALMDRLFIPSTKSAVIRNIKMLIACEFLPVMMSNNILTTTRVPRKNVRQTITFYEGNRRQGEFRENLNDS